MRCFRLLALLPIVVLATVPSARAQLAIGLGGTSGDRGRAIALDPSGNVHLTGSFNGTVDFDPGPGTLELVAGGSEAVFVASYDPSGALRYALSFAGEGYAIAADANGNVFVTGEIRGAAVDVDPGDGTVLLDPQEGRVFLVSYDADGFLRFARNFGGGLSNRVERGTAIAVDDAGDVYVTGIINDDTDFDGPSGEPPVQMNGVTDGFVASYGGDGGHRFGFGIGGTLSDAGYGIATRGASGCYVTGAFRGTVDFDPDPAELEERTSAGNQDFFLAAYSATGVFQHALAVGGAFDDVGQAVAVDAAGNAFVTGDFRDTVDFDPGPGVATVTSAGNRDFFLASYTDQDAFRFAFGLGSSNDMKGLGVALDDQARPWVTGEFTGGVDFDPGPADATILGDFDAFVASYTGTGDFRLAYNFDDIGMQDGESGEGIVVDGLSRAHVVGAFAGTNDFDPGPGSLELTSNGNDDIFFARSASPLVAVEPLPSGRPGGALGAPAPNPSGGAVRIDLVGRGSGRVQVAVYDVAGRLVATLYDGLLGPGKRKTLELAGRGLPSGTYFVRARDRSGVSGRTVVIVR